MPHSSRSHTYWICLLLTLAAAFLNLRDPIFPGSGLDASWVLATDHAARVGAAFGRDYVFTYGPYFRLAAQLFDPDRFGLVVIYDVVVVVLFCAPALITRSIGGLAAIVAALFFFSPSMDSLVMAAILAVFLATLLRRNVWNCVLVAACGPLVLSKLSFLLVLGPLMVLSDAANAPRRRLPVLTATLLVSVIVSLLAAGQALSDAPALAASSLAIILGYGRAMQLHGSSLDVVLALGLSALLFAMAAYAVLFRQWAGARFPGLRPLAALLDLLPSLAALAGLAWFLFIAFKAGFVRQDAHTAITFEAVALGAAVLWGYAGRPFEQLEKPTVRAAAMAGAGAVLVVACFVAGSAALSPQPHALAAAAARLEKTFTGAPARLYASGEWISGKRWGQMEARRNEALSALKRPFPNTVAGTVDVIPYDLAEVIASGLDYDPRPVIQSYSAYTPNLQQLDMAHFAGPQAPDTLFLKLLEIDNRLPTLAIGPSLPVIAARYDAVGLDKLGLILRKRETPRAMTERPLGGSELVLNQWVTVPSSSGVIMGRFDLPPTLAGRAAGFLFKDPLLALHLRGASGRVRTYRFIPGMAQIGAAISPLPSEGGLGALMLLDPAAAKQSDPVVALKVEGRGWAFKPGAVQFRAVDIAPGLGARTEGDLGLAGALTLSDATGHASLDDGEIFAHAPTTLSAPVAESVLITGSIGVRAHPPGLPDDGVRFTITAIDPTGGASLLFQKALPPGPSEAPLSVLAPAGSRLVLQTDVIDNANFDWSYWRIQSEPAPMSPQGK